MKNWREEILKYFSEPVPTLTIVSDPDGLFGDSKILKELNSRGIDFIPYEDPIYFRYLYETSYRDALEKASLKLVVRLEQLSFESVPYDVLRAAVKRDFSLSVLFPKLSYSVIKKLELKELDAISEVYEEYAGSNSDSDTVAFLLKKIYKLSWDSVKTQIDIFKLLIAIHCEGQHIPEIIAEFLEAKWQKIEALKELPLKAMISSEGFFLEFLQKKWEDLIRALQLMPECIQETEEALEELEARHPIAERNVRMLLDNMFADGKLLPIQVSNLKGLPKWVSFGIEYDEAGHSKKRLIERIFRASEKLKEDMGYRDWLQAAMVFGELKEKALALNGGLDEEVNSNLLQLQMQIDRLFSKWIFSQYNTLSNLPYLPNPVMVHHIPHYLANKRHDDKIALIVLDAMSFVQWHQIKDFLKSNFNFEENGVFAWIPTITSVSRQAIFCGERPSYYASSIKTTAKEERHWRLFWENHGIPQMYVDYTKIATYPDKYEEFENIKAINKVMAIVIDLIDQLIHSAMQGNKGLFEEVRLWLNNGFLEGVIKRLLEQNYQVFITSDHGNRECTGIGKILEGVLAHTRGERVRLYKSKELRDKAAAAYRGFAWDSPGLPEDMHSFVSPVDGAFVAEGEKLISHGSISIEEVIVPFIKVTAKEKGENIYG